MSEENILENEFNEILEFDYTTDVILEISQILKVTISDSVEEEYSEKGSIIPKGVLVNKILGMNLAKFDDDCNVTLGVDSKVYLAGNWLMRPVTYKNTMVPIMLYLQDKLDPKKIEMIPNKTGPEIRKEMWKHLMIDGSSYDLPTSARVMNRMEDPPPPGIGAMGGPPPGMQMMGPPPGMGHP